MLIKVHGNDYRTKVGLVYGYLGLERHQTASAQAGDIVALTGIEAPR